MSSAEAALVPKDEDDQDNGVGVLGWLGFVIINMAVWGIIGTSSMIYWPLGFVVCLIYIGLLIGMAICLEGRGNKYSQFVNLLWVVSCSFVFVAGAYLAVNVVGKSVDQPDTFFPGPPGPPAFFNPDLAQVLPDGSSKELKDWANDDKYWKDQPAFAVFKKNTFFSAKNSKDASNKYDEVLWRSDGANVTLVAPNLSNPNSFVTFKSKLYFSAYNEDTGMELWSISDPTAKAKLIGEVVEGSKDGNVGSLFVDEAHQKLYFKAAYYCPGGEYLRTIFSTDGVSDGIVDLRAEACPTSTSGKPGETPIPSGGGSIEKATLWGILLLADLPMLALAIFVLVKKNMPGIFFSLFKGIWVAATVLHQLSNSDSDDAYVFQKMFLTIFTSSIWIAIVLVQFRVANPPAWIDDMKTWAVVVNGAVFFAVLHFDLSIPVTESYWPWWVYAFVIGLQMGASMIVSRTFPMVLSAVGLFMIAWRIAYEILNFLHVGSSEVKTLLMLVLVGLEGVGIILAAVGYATKRSQIDKSVRELILKVNTKFSPVPNEGASP